MLKSKHIWEQIGLSLLILTSLASSASAQGTLGIRGGNWAMNGDNFQSGNLYIRGLSSSSTTTQAASVATRVANAMKALGCTTIRMPVNPPTVGDPNYWPVYQAAIDAVIADGMKVDLCYWIKSSSLGTIDDMTAWNAMWRTIDSVYGSNASVYFEPINEPYNYSASALDAIYRNFLTTYHPPNWKCIFDGTGLADQLSVIGADRALASQYLGKHIYQGWDGASSNNWRDYLPAMQSTIAGYDSRTIVTEMGCTTTDGADYYQNFTGGVWGEIAYLDGVTNYTYINNIGTLWWASIKDDDHYRWFNSSANLTLTNPSLIRQFQWAWHLGRTTVPTAPTELTATAGYKRVLLSWDASAGAITYNLYRSRTSGGERSTAIATGIKSTTYTNTGLTNGAAYYYKVAAVNSAGVSPKSNEAHASPAVGLANGTYTLSPACAASLVLDAAGSQTSNGTNVDIWTSNGGMNQKWTFTHMGDGWYKIQPSYSTTLDLEVEGQGTSNGSNVDLYTENGGPNQRWSVTRVPGGYRLTPENAPGQSLNVNGNGSTNGTNVQIWSYVGESGSIWTIK